jgi:hypothetical protein
MGNDARSVRNAFPIAVPAIAALIFIFALLGHVIGAALGIPTRLALPVAVRVFGGTVLSAGLVLLGWVFQCRKPVNIFVSTFLTMRKAVTGTLSVEMSRTSPAVQRPISTRLITLRLPRKDVERFGRLARHQPVNEPGQHRR